MTSTVALLLNPAARAGAHMHAATRAAARLRAAGIGTGVISGGSAAESTTLLRAALDVDADAVLVAGGDGTVNLALQELAGTGIPLGIIPCGTGNDLALALGLAEMDAEAAADAVIAGATRAIDLARVTRADGTVTRYGTVLAAGLDSKVNDRANRMRWPRGHSRYTIALLTEFLFLRGSAFELEIELADGSVEHIDRDLVLTAIGNGPSYGGGIPMCPTADFGDGLLDVTLVKPAGRLHLLSLLPRAYKGTHTTLDEVTVYRARSVRVHAPGITAYADGDPLGEADSLRVEVEPRAVTLFVP